MEATEAIGIPEAAMLLGVSTSRVHQFIRDGRLHGEQTGSKGIWVLNHSEVMNLAATERPQGWKKGRPRKAD